MEQEIILEGIHAMLEEIRDNVKKKPELEMISLKLAAIEKVYNDLVEKKLVTEDLMVGLISYLLKQMIDMNKKQGEKIEKLNEYVLGYHQYVKEQVITLQEEINAKLEWIEHFLKEKETKLSVWRNLKRWIE